MPNQRRTGLKLLNVWLDEETRVSFRAEAQSEGKDMSGLLRDLIDQHLEKHKKNVAKVPPHESKNSKSHKKKHDGT